MKTLIALLTLLFSINYISGQSIPFIQWQKTLGGSQAEYDGFREPRSKVVKTVDNGYIIAGVSTSADGDVSGNNGSLDAWIIKLNEKGALQWEKNFGGSHWDYVNSIQQTTDSGYIVCGVLVSTDEKFRPRPGSFDVWVMKLSYHGEVEWQRFYGGTGSDLGQSILQTDDGGYIFCGRTSSTDVHVSGNHGKSDIWVVKVDPSGDIEWQKCFGGGYTEFGNSVAKTADGGYIIGGWQSQSGSDIWIDQDMQAYVIKIDKDGNTQWEKKYGGSRYEDVNSIKQTADGGYVFVGTSLSNDGDVSGNHFDPIYKEYHDTWVVKLDNAGNISWQKCIGGTMWDEGYDIVEANDGYYIAGKSQSNDGDISGNHGLVDAMIAKLNLQGQIESVKVFGGSSVEVFYSLLLEPGVGDPEIVAAGTASSFDGDVKGNHGSVDEWVVKLSAAAFQFNMLTGAAYLDANANGLHDGGEPAYDNKYIYIRDNKGFYSKNKNTSPAFYRIQVDTGNYEADLNLPDTSRFRSVPKKKQVAFTNYGNTSFFEFALVDKNLLTNTLVWLSPDSEARPNLVTAYTGHLTYYGSREKINGILKIVKDRRLKYLSSSLTPVSIGQDTILLRFSDLYADTIQEFSVRFQLADVPVAKAGDTLRFRYNMMPLTVDSSHFDDWHTMEQVVEERANLIAGNVFLDNNRNGVRDNNEGFLKKGLVISEKLNSSISSSLNEGQFFNLVDTGTYVSKLVLNEPYYHVEPALHNSHFTNYYNIDSFDFAIVPVAGIRDLQISVIPLNPAKPGFTGFYNIVIENKGTDTVVNASVEFIKDPRTSFNSSFPSFSSIQGDTLTWNIGTVFPQQDSMLVLSLTLAAPPILKQDDSLRFKGTIFPVSGDSTASDNIFELKQVVVNSFDPNDKVESHAGRASVKEIQDGGRLNYIIRFQNTGNAPATNISISDTLDSKLDWSSFEMTHSSHPYSMQITNGKVVTWSFENIMLADSVSNEPASHGYVAYRIKAKKSVAGGDVIKNKASIFFDFNAPISTNLEQTILEVQVALPVSFAHLTAVLHGQVVDVRWKTEYENNAREFHVQRSSDGIDFENIGIVKALNQSGSSYLFTDQQPLEGDNYYRLISIDLDGTPDASRVLLVRVKNENVVTSVLPNPTNSTFNLKINGSISGTVRVILYSHSGQQIWTRDYGRFTGSNFKAAIDVGRITKGTYILKTLIDGKIYVNQLLLQ